ncbi:MAG: patatin-like phospholipase family protein [Rubrivivax sp.]|nr:patatin-like phospholipase family protein [Rubrivivax sp.]
MAETSRIGVVLSSGGGRGVYAHTGFLLALEQLGIPISACAGCSAGAIVGGVAASGTSLNVWAQAISAVSQRDFWTPDSLPRVVWQLTARRGRGYTGLSGTGAAISFCRRVLAVQTFAQCRYPFYAVAMSLGRARKEVFSAGELAPRMMASAAIPAFYKPVQIDGDLYCDGALIDLAPMDAICCRHGLDALIVHHVARRHDRTAGVETILGSRWAFAEISARVLFHRRPWYLSDEPLTLRHCPCGCGAVIVVIEPDLPELGWPLTEGGPRVQQAAAAQTLALLQPLADALLTDPRTRLLVQAGEPAGNSAHRAPVCAPGLP